MSSYSEKLRDPRWQRMRLTVMGRDDFACRACRTTTATLNVHHSHYRKSAAPWDYAPEHLVTLCEPCHLVAEERRERILKATAEPAVQLAVLHLALLLAGRSQAFAPGFRKVLEALLRAMQAELAARQALRSGGGLQALEESMLETRRHLAAIHADLLSK
ncbi:HNH endonuclease [Luteolibacter sp. Populi]|uniref:HNH endonuclease n=1 Tax=Luteolibacter sp. Populi TaxID=3230487 RepID=UPI0034672673